MGEYTMFYVFMKFNKAEKLSDVEPVKLNKFSAIQKQYRHRVG